MELSPGYFLDRYELLCPLADGGMASVWVARLRGKHGFEKLLAIKTVLPQFAADERFQQMFLDEARIASRIEHANVAQILDVGEQHDITYLVMEWVDGDSLSRLYRSLRKKGMTLPLNVLLRVVADACAGLHEAHEQGVVHRDVSPQNILVSQRGVAKVIDFGIAKARDSAVGVETNAGLLKGKIHYMAPEQARGHAVDRRADVFALGALLYHYIAGSPPFDGDNQIAVLGRLTSGEPAAPLSASVPAAVSAIVMRALAHDANARFATAHDLKDAIESAMTANGLACTQAQVAAFVAEHGASRTASRKEAIGLAISAAAERERVREVLRPNPEKSATGVLASDARFVHTSSFPPPPLTPPPISAPPPLPSGSIDVVVVEPAQRRGKLAVLAVVLVVMGVAAGAAITFFVATHKEASSSLGASSPPPAATTAAAKTIATAPPSATIDIAGVDPDSLPSAEPTASSATTVAAPAHTATTAPTESATTPQGTSRRSKYGF
ncbi:MAG TPA: serine/threonine-protein kinase [Polyangiaceae bacterium]